MWGSVTDLLSSMLYFDTHGCLYLFLLSSLRIVSNTVFTRYDMELAKLNLIQRAVPLHIASFVMEYDRYRNSWLQIPNNGFVADTESHLYSNIGFRYHVSHRTRVWKIVRIGPGALNFVGSQVCRTTFQLCG